MIDPSTAAGTVILDILASIGVIAIMAVGSWVLGPVKWLVHARRIRKIIGIDRRFLFVYNPDANKSKVITFSQNGQIGEGRNSNEHSWRIRRGKLEIIHADGKCYSRFRYDPESGRLINTNEPGTRSIHGQFFVPQWELPN